MRNYLAAGQHVLLSEFVEIESGRKSDQPKLIEALVACQVHGAKLVIAELDRLTRNVCIRLKPHGVDFEAVDFPQANRLTFTSSQPLQST